METSKNQVVFDLLTALRFPKETALNSILALQWKHKRILARHLNSSHTAINKVFSGEMTKSPIADKTFKALGIKNPWAS
jgi:hypothetical protein